MTGASLKELGAYAAAVTGVFALAAYVWRKLIRHVVRWIRVQTVLVERLDPLLAFVERHADEHADLAARMERIESLLLVTTTTDVALIPQQIKRGVLGG